MTTALCYPLMSFRGIFSFFVYLAAFELIRRVNYRKELPCPHCGFDASWYRKDVKVARRLVASYWSDKQNSQPETVTGKKAVDLPIDDPYEETNFDHRF
jgi:hypothetical protein